MRHIPQCHCQRGFTLPYIISSAFVSIINLPISTASRPRHLDLAQELSVERARSSALMVNAIRPEASTFGGGRAGKDHTCLIRVWMA